MPESVHGQSRAFYAVFERTTLMRWANGFEAAGYGAFARTRNMNAQPNRESTKGRPIGIPNGYHMGFQHIGILGLLAR